MGFQLQANCSQPPLFEGADQQLGALSPEPVAGIRLSTTDSTFPAHPGTSNASYSAARLVCASGKLSSQGAARLALGGWAVEGVHVGNPLTSQGAATRQLAATKTRDPSEMELGLHPPRPASLAGRAPTPEATGAAV